MSPGRGAGGRNNWDNDRWRRAGNRRRAGSNRTAGRGPDGGRKR